MDTPNLSPTRWTVWRQPLPVVCLIVGFDLLAALSGVGHTSFSTAQLRPFAVIAALSATYSLITLRSEKLRPALAEGRCPNMVGVWTAAAAVLLPVPWTTLLCVVAYAAEWPSRRELYRGRPHKHVFSAAVCIVSCVAMSEAFDLAGGGIVGLALSVLAFSVVNVFGIASVLVAGGNRSVLIMFASPRAHAREFGTQALGVLGAVGMQWHLLVGLVILPCVVVIQRLALKESMAEPDKRDAASNVWSERVWSILASHRLAADKLPAVLILIEPVAGVARADVARVVAAHSRPADLLGCMGPHALALLAPHTPSAAGPFMAQQLRVALRQQGMEAYVGDADNAGGENLDAMLVIASAALATRSLSPRRRRAEAA